MKLNKLRIALCFFAILSFNSCNDTIGAAVKQPTIPVSEMAQMKDGITPSGDDSLAFVLFAPHKKEVYLIGDFNDWSQQPEYKMEQYNDRFYLKIGNLEANKPYICQYLIDGKIRIADPYATQISDPLHDHAIPSSRYPNLISYPKGKTTEIAMVVQTPEDKYNWKITDFKAPESSDLLIYEILLRDFTNEGTIKAAHDKIPYLKNLGINAIELMPFNEFDANNSWGYNPTFYFATDKTYGPTVEYKRFIDACHQQGMAVIMDMVLNHSYGQSPLLRMYQTETGAPSAQNPWYNEKSNFAIPDAQWGSDFNHESALTHQLIDSICSFWMDEFKIDGFRFDFTKGFSNTPYPAQGDDAWESPFDAARIKNLKRINQHIKQQNPDAILIFEHLADNKEEKVLADAGILLWGNLNHSFNAATMGCTDKSDISWGSYKERGWKYPHLISYMESHDEERIMYKNKAYGAQKGDYDVKNLPTALERTEAAAVMLYAVPGPKMIWQFGEVGYDFALQEGGADRLECKPIHWEYYDDPARRDLYNVYATMSKLRSEHPAFSSTDYVMEVSKAFKQILLKSAEGDICVMANFDIEPQTQPVLFGSVGKWEELFTHTSLQVSSATQNVLLNPGEYKIYYLKK